MKEDELFQIQHDQVTDEINKIRWIANNPDKLIRALRAKIAEQNSNYLRDDMAPASRIFRGQDISTWLSNQLANHLKKEGKEEV